MMSKERKRNIVWSAILAAAIGLVLSFSLGNLVALAIADSDLETAVRSVRAVATNRGGEVRSVNQNDDHSYSITAIMRDDQLGRLEELLAGQPDGVTWEYVYAPSSVHDDYLRVGVDLSMTPEHFSVEWGRSLSSPGFILLMFVLFLPIFGSAFVIFGSGIFRPALLPASGAD